MQEERLVVLVGLREEDLGGKLGEDDGAEGLAGLRDETGLEGKLGEHGGLLAERHLQRERRTHKICNAARRWLSRVTSSIVYGDQRITTYKYPLQITVYTLYSMTI